jgi:hypothetical protein
VKARNTVELAAALLLLVASMTAVASAAAGPSDAETVVRGFLHDVRAGRDPAAVTRYFPETVAAH